MDRNLMGDNTGRSRSKGMSDMDGDCRLNHCVVDCHSFLGTCDCNSDSRLIGAEVT